MKKIVIFLLIILFSYSYSAKIFAYSSDPEQFINELVMDAIEKLSNKDLTKDQKADFISEIALENVDINALGLYTLGEIRKSSEKEDVARYQSIFKLYFLKSLTSRLSDYSSSKFEVTGAEKKVLITQLLIQKLFQAAVSQKSKLTGGFIPKIQINHS